MLKNHLSRYKVIIWDFDGTIKDSELRKNNAYFILFQHLNSSYLRGMDQYLKDNIGISRESKITGCMELIGLEISSENVRRYLDQFAEIACTEVIASEWIEEVKIYIEENYKNQILYLVTQTPQHEIEQLLSQLNFFKYFKNIYGGIKSKVSCMDTIINNEKIPKSLIAAVGDSQGDSDAAYLCGIDFYKKNHSYNKEVKNYKSTF
jgi:phosphoglycolate phosphatase-like HAD superfamily hydrolase